MVGWFAEWGATVIDSDALAIQSQQPGSDTLAELSHEFGESILLPDGSLDRAELRRIMVADRGAREALNAIVHPAVRALRDELAAQALSRGDSILVHDIPLLFEVLDPNAFDMVVLVESPDSVRRVRLLDRGLSEEEADQLMATQMPSEKKRARSDVIIENRGTLEELRREANKAWLEICMRAGR